jgi:hypothetical protein
MDLFASNHAMDLLWGTPFLLDSSFATQPKSTRGRTGIPVFLGCSVYRRCCDAGQSPLAPLAPHQPVLRVMLQARWSAEAWSVVRVEFKRALALRSEIRRAGGWAWRSRRRRRGRPASG